jgi:hypothetical protein
VARALLQLLPVRLSIRILGFIGRLTVRIFQSRRRRAELLAVLVRRQVLVLLPVLDLLLRRLSEHLRALEPLPEPA